MRQILIAALCGVAVAGGLLLGGLGVQGRDETYARTIAHLCALTRTTGAVWEAAITSYATLPNPTPDQLALLAQLRRGVAEIRRDNSCQP